MEVSNDFYFPFEKSSPFHTSPFFFIKKRIGVFMQKREQGVSFKRENKGYPTVLLLFNSNKIYIKRILVSPKSAGNGDKNVFISMMTLLLCMLLLVFFKK